MFRSLLAVLIVARRAELRKEPGEAPATRPLTRLGSPP